MGNGIIMKDLVDTFKSFYFISLELKVNKELRTNEVTILALWFRATLLTMVERMSWKSTSWP